MQTDCGSRGRGRLQARLAALRFTLTLFALGYPASIA